MCFFLDALRNEHHAAALPWPGRARERGAVTATKTIKILKREKERNIIRTIEQKEEYYVGQMDDSEGDRIGEKKNKKNRTNYTEHPKLMRHQNINFYGYFPFLTFIFLQFHKKREICALHYTLYSYHSPPT